MKGYYEKKELRLVGKAWEIRYKLRRISKQARPNTTLEEWLRSHAETGADHSKNAATDRSQSVVNQRSYPMA